MSYTLDRHKILVIDDEEPIRDGCKQALEKSGYNVITAKDGQEGLKAARENHPDMVFIDLKMPGISGMDLIDILSKELPDSISVVITGFASIVSAVEALKKGAYDYLPKPFSPDQIRVVTKRGLEHRDLKIEARKLNEEKKFMEKNFITFVSHEMRSPLAVIQQYIESLKLIAGDKLDENALSIIDRCEKRIQNLKELIEHWLDLRRIESGTFITDKKNLNLADIIRKATEDILPLSQKRGISLKINIPENIPEIVGDKESLIRVFVNIIGNATKYTPSGGSISISEKHNDRYVDISISDTGAGIPKEKLPFIFDAFYRAKDKEDKHRGSGLGLTFCKRIMDAHGGIIDVSSEEGKGTTFVLRFIR